MLLFQSFVVLKRILPTITHQHFGYLTETMRSFWDSGNAEVHIHRVRLSHLVDRREHFVEFIQARLSMYPIIAQHVPVKLSALERYLPHETGT